MEGRQKHNSQNRQEEEQEEGSIEKDQVGQIEIFLQLLPKHRNTQRRLGLTRGVD